MRSQNTLSRVSLINEIDNEGNEMPLKVEIRTWISFMPVKSGRHAKDIRSMAWHVFVVLIKPKFLSLD